MYIRSCRSLSRLSNFLRMFGGHHYGTYVLSPLTGTQDPLFGVSVFACDLGFSVWPCPSKDSIPSRHKVLIDSCSDVWWAGQAEAVKNWVGPINPGLTGPFSPKKWVGPTICFALFPPKSDGARAQPAHTLPPGLNEYIRPTVKSPVFLLFQLQDLPLHS